ncbi:MAG: 50S ribosomal protein L35 [Dehalococcoidia bacterium]|nr:50S ribosomal protein L35 [Dehalococcoidia bacterium]
MPKLKTHKPASRRFHVTGSGKIMRTKGGKSHLRRKKPGRVKRLYDAKLPLHPSDKARIKRLIPYS